jgi:hypothetical protein
MQKKGRQREDGTVIVGSFYLILFYRLISFRVEGGSRLVFKRYCFLMMRYVCVYSGMYRPTRNAGGVLGYEYFGGE